MKLENIKDEHDLLQFMKENIKYGWLDTNNEEHIGNMKNFRRLYRTSSLDEVLSHDLGCCIEQVFLMKSIFDTIGIESKMFATRIFEGEDFNDLDSDEHMHCFLLFKKDHDDKVYQIEHPNWEKIGIYKYKDEETAIKEINEYYEKRNNGNVRDVTQFYEVPTNISFKEFNLYINKLDTMKTI